PLIACVAQESRTLDAQYIVGNDATLNLDNKGSMVLADNEIPTVGELHNSPNEEERRTLRRVAGKLPSVAYLICAVEFAERASYYGVQPLFSNYVNRPMPKDGNGWGAPKRGTEDTAGALGEGTVKATAVSQSFSMLAYALPLFAGYLSDTRTGRFNMICAGVGVCGLAHVIMMASGAKTLLANGDAKIPFLISVYILAIGAAMFKPNISPTLLDQMKSTKLETKTLKTGEKVIIDPEHTTERVMLWFYLLINVGGFMNVPTSYTAKYVGWWLSFGIPLILYLPLPFLLWFLKKKLILHPPGGSDLGHIMRIIGICFKRGGWKSIGRGGFFDPARPSVIATSGDPIEVPWNDAFVDDVRRAFQATGIFMFFPIQGLNDSGLGNSASALSTMLSTKGVPNDVISNFNSLSIICMAPVLNFGLYPLLRRWKIHFGSISRMTVGFFMAACGGAGYTLLNWYAYKQGPCGHYGSSPTCVDAEGNALTADISIWWMAIPYALGGISELFVNVPAYGIAYSRAPQNMRGLVSGINLFTGAITYAIGLACSGLVKDPYLTDIDHEEYLLTQNLDYETKVREEKLAKENRQEHDLANGSSVGSEKGDIAHAHAKEDFGGEKNAVPEIKEG
ncbi:Peptide transporter, partial [Lachnellula occidentalis]